MHTAFKIAALNFVFEPRAFLKDPDIVDRIYGQIAACASEKTDDDEDTMAGIMAEFNLAVPAKFMDITYMGYANMVVDIATAAYQASRAAAACGEAYKYTCPKCGEHRLKIDCTRTAVVQFSADGGHDILEDGNDDDLTWDDQSHAECAHCDFHSDLYEFKT